MMPKKTENDGPNTFRKDVQYGTERTSRLFKIKPFINTLDLKNKLFHFSAYIQGILQVGCSSLLGELVRGFKQSHCFHCLHMIPD